MGRHLASEGYLVNLSYSIHRAAPDVSIATVDYVVIRARRYYVKVLNLEAKPSLLGKFFGIEKDVNMVIFQK
jgi:hypothetical protein